MKKKILVITVAMVMAASLMACGGSSDKKEKKTTSANENQQVTEDGTSSDTDEKKDNKDEKKKYVMKCDGEDIKTAKFGRDIIDYYAPASGYTELGGADVFAIEGQLMFVVDCYNDELLNKDLEDQMDIWMHEFNQDLGTDVKVKTDVFDKDLSNAWKWIDKQEYETVKVNGRECIKFSGIVGANLKSDDINVSNYVTGYIFNIKHTKEDGTVYTKPMAFVGSYLKYDYSTEIDMTEQQKEELNNNIDIMMESMTLDDNSARIDGETIE